MSNLVTIYNENYGSSVSTNGQYIAIGNPPSFDYSSGEGFARIGQVFLVKKNKFKNNYSLIKTFSKTIYTENGIYPTYFTEHDECTYVKGSLIYESGSYTNTDEDCTVLVVEDGNKKVYQSKYGSAIDLSNYFLAVGDRSHTSSFCIGQTSSYAEVCIYTLNPNYTSSYGRIIKGSLCQEDIDDYTISDIPTCVLTGSGAEFFGSSISITDTYLAVGAPNAINGRGAVYIYKYFDNSCGYELEQILTSDIVTYPTQKGFGFSISLDKKRENRIIVGSNQISQSNVYLYKSGSHGWELNQTFSQNTNSGYYKLTDGNFYGYPSGSQINTKYGYSVSMYDNLISVGSPSDLTYWDYSGSVTLRQRGAVYVYKNDECVGTSQYSLLTKIYGDATTFKDNLCGYSVSTFDNKILIGSPKPYFPFSSLYISASFNVYEKTFNNNDIGESTYNGQVLLYKHDNGIISQITTDPISSRKKYGRPFNAFGYSVSLSNENLIVGAPIPLNDDFHLSSPFVTESGSVAAGGEYILTSSTYTEDCTGTSDVIYIQLEDHITDSNGSVVNVALAQEQDYLNQTWPKIRGQSYIYNFDDLKTNYNVGNVFYNNYRFTLINTGSILEGLTLDPVDPSNSYLYMNYDSIVNLFEKQYLCTIESGEFNVSTNPSAIIHSTFEYAIVNKNKFDFNNLDLILRYIHYKNTTSRSEKWWDTFVQGDVELSMFNHFVSTYSHYESNRLTSALKSQLCDKNFDVNGDGASTIQDGLLIWKYFIEDLVYTNYTNYINPNCSRKNYNDLISFLNEKTGKYLTNSIKSEFFGYQYSSSIDPTGSYLSPYITQIGLYNDANLVAIAKLAHPIKNTGEIPINIAIKWDT